MYAAVVCLYVRMCTFASNHAYLFSIQMISAFGAHQRLSLHTMLIKCVNLLLQWAGVCSKLEVSDIVSREKRRGKERERERERGGRGGGD